MAKIKIRLNGRPMDILLKGVQRDGIPVLVVKPAPESVSHTSASKPGAQTGVQK